MSANHIRNQKPVSSTIKRSSLLPCLLAILAISGFSANLLHAQAASTANANPYSQVTPGISGANQGIQSPMGAGMQGASVSPSGVQTLGPSQAASAPSMALLYPDPTQYTLAPGDLISIRLYSVPDYATVDRISKDGTVQLPLIGSVNLGGITIRQAEDLIATRLKTAGMFRNPEVTIGIAESSSPQTISFAGEKTGLYLVQGQRNLLDVLAGSGGLPPTASRTVSIIRPGTDAPILVNLGTTPQELIKANVPIFPHDTIFVERAGTVYVLGAFKQPGAYPLQPTGMTLMQMASLAGGPAFSGKYGDMRIVRTVGTERQEVKVDIKRIMFGQDPDPLLQPGDILFLPTAVFKQALASGGIQTLLSAISILVIAAYQH
jgi:polysaccharide export outer membrane protein